MEPKIPQPRIPMVCVAWHDAGYHDQDVYPDDTPKPIGLILHSIGWLIRQNPEGIVLGMDWSEHDSSYRHIQEIPAAYIKSVRRMAWGRNPRPFLGPKNGSSTTSPSSAGRVPVEDPQSEGGRTVGS